MRTNGGTSYSPISGESGTLPGTGDGKTTLSLTGVNSTYNNNKYKVIFTTTNNECPEETTAATLKINTAPTAEAGNNVTINCTNPNAQLMASGGTSYSWSPATGLTDATIKNPVATPTSTTTYTVTVTDANGCKDTDTVKVTVDKNKPTANAGSDATINCNDTNAQLTASGGTSYLWSPATGLNKVNIANPITSPNTTTDYTVTVTATNGCSATDTVRVTVDENKPTANAGTDATINCNDTNAQLMASGGASYFWSPASGLSDVNIANPIASPSTTTDYTVTVTATNGCSATDTVRVTVDTNKPTANAGSDATINCNDTTAQLMASGGTSYSWSPATGLNKVNIANPIASPNTTTDYTVTVTATNGCSATDTVRITVDENKPTANAGTDATINCNDTSVQLTASGGTSYLWSPATGLSDVNIANPIASPSTTTDYTVTVTAINGCKNIDLVTVTVDQNKPTANAGSDATINCNDTNAQLMASGGASYFWSPASGLSDVNIANPIASPSTTTDYTVTVTATNGCSATDTVRVTVDTNKPTANAGSDATINCNDTTAQLMASGGTSYSWSPATGLNKVNIANPIASPNTTTDYTVTVTATNGCSATDTVRITVDTNKPTANAGSDATINCNDTNAQLMASGGTSYSWSPATGLNKVNIANPIASPNTTTDYTVTVTATNGCSATDTVRVTVDQNKPTANAGSDATINCNDTNAQLTASGGTSYSWSPATGLNNVNIANPTASPSTTTDYTVTVTATNGCSATDTVRVTVDTNKPTANAGSDATINCNDTNTQLTASGGTSYSWSPATGLSDVNIANPIASPSTTTDYTVTVTATNGCSATDTVRITVDTNKPTANAGSDATINCNDTSAQLTASGGTSYSWSPATGLNKVNIANPIASPSTTTDYTVTVTATNGCSSTDTVRVTVDTNKPTANAGSDATINCNDTTAQLTASGGTSYSWSPATGLDNVNIANPTASPSTTTDYTVTVTATNGCSSTDTVRVTVDTTAPTANAGADVTINCSNTSETLSATGGVFYSWSPAAGLSDVNAATPVATPNTTTIYTVTVTGANGCTDTDSVKVTVDKSTPTVNAGVDQELNCTTTSVTLDGSNSASGTNIAYQWSTNDGTLTGATNASIATASAIGTYTLKVTNTTTGCFDEDSVTVTASIAKPTADAGADFTITCSNNIAGKEIGTATTTGYTYLWSPTTGLSNPAISNPFANPTTTTTYEVTVTNSANVCLSKDTVTVTVDNTPPTAQDIQGSTNTLCAQETTTLSTATTGNIVWNSLNTAVATIDASTGKVTAIAAGTANIIYTVTGSNSCSSNSKEYQINVNPLPATPAIIGKSALCVDDKTTLTTTATGTVVWSSSNTAVATLDANTGEVTGISAGTTNISYTVTNSSGCSSTSADHQITINPLPATPAITGKSTLCNGDNTTLSTVASGTVVWSSSDTSVATINENTGEVTTLSTGTTNISYTVTDGNSCTSQNSDFSLKVNPLAYFEVTDEQVACSNNLPLVLRVENANDTYTYQWKDPSGNDLGTQTTQEVSIGGKYTVTATKNDGASCSTTKTITVIESSPPATTLDDITVVDSSENNSISINTTTTGNGNYEFALFNEEGTSIIRYYQTDPYFEQLEVGIYTIKIRDRNGCGEVNFTVPVLNFPKFFTPDNDGIKDVWSVEGVTETFFTKRSAVYVFNRYGKVLAKLNANESWDGIYIGKNVIPTDYWYKVELIDKNEKVYRREGNFSLIRE